MALAQAEGQSGGGMCRITLEVRGWVVPSLEVWQVLTLEMEVAGPYTTCA